MASWVRGVSRAGGRGVFCAFFAVLVGFGSAGGQTGTPESEALVFDAIDGLAPASDRPTPSATIERRPRRELRSSPVPDNHHNTVTPGAVAATRDARAPHIFGTVAVRSGMPPREWVRRVTHGSQTFQRCLSRGTDCGAHTPSWRALVDEAAQTDGMERLSLVNRRVNSAIAYRRDAVATGLIDSWATPDYILTRQEGDCEDFALAKFWTLRSAGVPAEDMYVLRGPCLSGRTPGVGLRAARQPYQSRAVPERRPGHCPGRQYQPQCELYARHAGTGRKHRRLTSSLQAKQPRPATRHDVISEFPCRSAYCAP